MPVQTGAHNSFETGAADGTDITVANSDDGDEHHPFAEVSVVGAGSLAKYATTTPDPLEGLGAIFGEFGIPSGATTKEALVSFDYTATEWWWRAYFHVPTLPAGDALFVAIHDDADSIIGGLRLSAEDEVTPGSLRLIDANQADVAGGTSAIPIAAWFRMEGHVIHDASAGRLELQLFEDPDSDTADAEIGAFFADTGGGSEVSRVSWGIHETSDTNALTIYIDAIAWTDEDWIGRAPIDHLPPVTNYAGVGVRSIP